MIQWFKAWRRTHKALRTLKREIDVLRIELGVRSMWSIKDLSKSVDPHNSRKLSDLCKQYLIVKRVGADAAVLYKLEGAA